MATLLQQLRFIYSGGKLKRFHARDTLTSQNIADHSFGVAWLLALQYDPDGDGPRPQVIMGALAHDLGEYIAGDVPGDTKKRVPELKRIMNELEDSALKEAGLLFNLTEDEKKLVKFADLMEGLMFCVRERRLGSKACNEIWVNYWRFAKEMNPTGRTAQLLAAIETLYMEASV